MESKNVKILETQRNREKTGTPALILCWDKECGPKQLGGKGRFIWSAYLDHSQSWREVRYRLRKNMEPETEAEFRGDAVAALRPALLDLSRLRFYTSRTTLPRGGITHSGLHLPTEVIKQENVPCTCMQSNPIEAFSQWMFLLSRWAYLCQINKKKFLTNLIQIAEV